MKTYLLIIPVAFLVAYSQIVVKWRSNTGHLGNADTSGVDRVLMFLADPVILSAYASALFASFAWLFVVSKLPLTIAFPVYIGVTFAMVLFGGWYFLAEAMTVTRLMAIVLIFSGIVIGIRE